MTSMNEVLAEEVDVLTKANAALTAQRAELLAELKLAHKIIGNARLVMGPMTKTELVRLNEHTGINSMDRAEERQSIIAKVETS